MHVEIAGGGIIGLSIAWRLAQAGRKVRVRERGKVARQASWAGAGMLAPAGEFRPGTRWARLAVESLAEYPAFVAELAAASGLPIDYRETGALELSLHDEELAALRRTRPDGIVSEEVSPAAAAAFAPIRPGTVRAARWFPREAIVDPRDVCAALVVACKALGVEICEDDPLLECGTNPTVIAAGAWSCQILGVPQSPEAFPVKGHLLGYYREPGSLPTIVRHGHHYALQRRTGFTIFGSDELAGTWDTAPDPGRVEGLASAAAFLLPDLLDGPPDEVWAGLRPGSGTGEPVVEKVPDRNIWLAYGHFRNGILLAPVTARSVVESIVSTGETD